MSEVKDIYKMKLHKSIKLPINANGITHSYIITRVAGGWLYESTYNEGGIIFVPYNNDMADPYNGVL